MAANKKTNGRTKANTTSAAARAAGAKQPADYKAASTDIEADIVEFEFEGETYEVDADNLDDLEIMEVLMVSLARGLRQLLGAEEWSRVEKNLKEADPKGKLRISKVRSFFETMQDQVGPLA